MFYRFWSQRIFSVQLKHVSTGESLQMTIYYGEKSAMKLEYPTEKPWLGTRYFYILYDGVFFNFWKKFSVQNDRVHGKWKSTFLHHHNVEMNWRQKPIRALKVLKGHDDHVITCLQFSGNRYAFVSIEFIQTLYNLAFLTVSFRDLMIIR